MLGGYTNGQKGSGQGTKLGVASSYGGPRDAGSMNPSFQPLTYGGASPGTIRGTEGTYGNHAPAGGYRGGGVGASSLAGYGQGSVGGGGEGANWVSVSGASTYVHGNADAFHHQEVTIKRLQEDLKNAHNEQV